MSVTGVVSPTTDSTMESSPALGTEPDDVIFVTGFGPFGQHVVNGSWEAVCRLHDFGPHHKFGAKLVIEEVPVQYEYVMREIPRRWRQLRPRLVVHVGVSDQTMSLQLERRAHNGPYQRCDVESRTPPDACCAPGCPDELVTTLNLENACRALDNTDLPVEATVSEDPGRYLCDFIYYTSLKEDASRTVFVHVPPYCLPFPAQVVSEALALVIEQLYTQVLIKDGKSVEGARGRSRAADPAWEGSPQKMAQAS